MTINPLQLPTVATKIFNYLYYSELSQKKRVCKRWNQLISDNRFEASVKDHQFAAKILSKKQATRYKKLCIADIILEKIEKKLYDSYIESFTFQELLLLGNSLSNVTIKNLENLSIHIHKCFDKVITKKTEISGEILTVAESVVYPFLKAYPPLFPPPIKKNIQDTDLINRSLSIIYKKQKTPRKIGDNFKKLTEDEIKQNEKKIKDYFVKNLAPLFSLPEWEEMANFKDLNLFFKLKQLNFLASNFLLTYQEASL